ncbi:MAG: sugar ABC transporter ATP-binding protein [Acetobacteraceae bacterium]|nr:sugar ABC transporter ATP-binding protein [Acetobacteraceae bacterium]
MELLGLRGIGKRFGGVTALAEVDFTLREGEIHGLVGENGAGKSTLMKIIAGVHAEFDGEMRLAGEAVRFASPRAARDHGIGMVHQELATVPTVSVAENVFMGAPPMNRLGLVDWGAMRSGAREQLQALGVDVDPAAPMGSLPLGVQQLVELSRVLFSGAKIIILDEPTSALSPPEVERLFAALRRLREAGRSLIFISHFLDDVLAICDRVTVFRNGRAVASEACGAVDKGWIIEQMIGTGHGHLEESYVRDIALPSRADSPVVLQVRGLSCPGAFRDVSLEVREGEVLGLYGFLGAGQLDLARSLFGAMPAAEGSFAVDGRPVRLTSTARARAAGIAFVPESRRMMLFASAPVFKNVSISVLDRIARVWLRPGREREIASGHAAGLHIRPPGVDLALGALSGGNQQKVALAKWLTRLPRVMLLSEPTRGMDVGAKEDVLTIVRGLREKGIGIVVASTEPETVLSLSDRILVMKKGEIVREFTNEPVSKDRLLAAA